jgi:hypothetical protein
MDETNLTTPKTVETALVDNSEGSDEIRPTGCSEKLLTLPSGSHHGEVLGGVNCDAEASKVSICLSQTLWRDHSRVGATPLAQ